ncbi:MAG: prolyl oligopeptidase family serine peptidase [Anaerolineae bacterium]
MPQLTYPTTPTVEQIDDYHGTPVADPYRWLEATDAPDTRAWIEAQNAVTFDFLGRIEGRDTIRRRLTELWDMPTRWAPVKRGGRYFQLRNTGLQNQDALYVMDGLHDAGRILLDPNTLSDDGAVALTSWSVSDDGQWLAYATSDGGSDWLTWRIRDVGSGEDLPDVVAWSKFSGAAWRPDGSGFFYSRYDAPAPGQDLLGVNYNQKVYFHTRGTPQIEDSLVYERADQREWGFGAVVSDDGRYLILHVSQGTDVRKRLFYKDLAADGPVVELIPDLEAAYWFVANDGPVFYVQTDLDAPRGRLIAIDTTTPAKAHWRTVIPQSADTLEHVEAAYDGFVAVYLHDAHHQLGRFAKDGAPLGHIPLPTLGAIPLYFNTLQLAGRAHDDELFFAFWSFLFPVTVYRYDFARAESDVLYAPPIKLDTSGYVTRQVFATSQDGTRIPMFLTHREDLPRDGQNPTLLYGYGGFNIALTPSFQAGRLSWLALGGVLAWANLRGGGEYGETWRRAGMLDRKQNVFDDFIACAEYLVQHQITSPAKLAIQGGSNGGLLVGAVLNQRPDLFGAALPAVGVMDMLRFQRFTIGWAWVSDFGSSDDPAQFKTLYAYSPLHNIRPGARYPAVLVTTGDHDDRVVPSHSFKYAAALQAAQAGDAPILIRIQTRAGHGMGKPTAMLIEETADQWAFLAHALGMEVGR